MKRKNKLKSLVTSCFICGKDLVEIEDKIGHRINPEKGNSIHNLLVVCTSCKRLLAKTPIFNITLDKNSLRKYFKKLGLDSKKIILEKIKIMKDKNND